MAGLGLCRQLLSSRGCATALPGALTRSAVLRSAVISARGFSTGDGTKPAYTSDYFLGVILFPLVLLVVRIACTSQLVKNKPLVVFMKGDPSAPMCGFSRLVVQILHMHGKSNLLGSLCLAQFMPLFHWPLGVERYDHYDVLGDIDFKEGIKKFSNWPTFPQVYINSELVGGADIILQMHQSGDMVAELEKIGHKSALLETQQSKDT